MSAGVKLPDGPFLVEPGGQVTIEVTVRNVSGVVDDLAVSVLGAAETWSSVDPPSISLFPNTDGAVRITFAPPRDSGIPMGPMPFGVHVVPSVDPEGAVVVEGTLEIGQFVDAFLELIPRTTRGRRSAVYDIALDNRGNVPLNFNLVAADPDNQLLFEANPPGIVSEPGTASFSKLHVRPRDTFWRGTPQARQFQLRAEPTEGLPITADGTFLQEALLPRGLGKALLAALAAIVALLLLWFLVLKPTVKSTAKDAVKDQVAAQDAKIAEQQKQIDQASGRTAALEQIVTGTTSSTSPTTVAPAGGLPGPARSQTLSVTPGPGAPLAKAASAALPSDSFSMTDVIFGNANNGSGLLELTIPGETLLRINLANFRDLDYHWVSPIVVPKGQTVTLNVTCDPAPNVNPCNVTALLSGFTQPAL